MFITMLAGIQNLYLPHNPCLKRQKIPDQTPLFCTSFLFAISTTNSFTDAHSWFLSISLKLTSQQQLRCISRYKGNWKKSSYMLCTGVTNKFIRGNSVKVLMTWRGAACLFSRIIFLSLSSCSWKK